MACCLNWDFGGSESVVKCLDGRKNLIITGSVLIKHLDRFVVFREPRNDVIRLENFKSRLFKWGNVGGCKDKIDCNILGTISREFCEEICDRMYADTRHSIYPRHVGRFTLVYEDGFYSVHKKLGKPRRFHFTAVACADVTISTILLWSSKLLEAQLVNYEYITKWVIKSWITRELALARNVAGLILRRCDDDLTYHALNIFIIWANNGGICRTEICDKPILQARFSKIWTRMNYEIPFQTNFLYDVINGHPIEMVRGCNSRVAEANRLNIREYFYFLFLRNNLNTNGTMSYSKDVLENLIACLSKIAGTLQYGCEKLIEFVTENGWSRNPDIGVIKRFSKPKNYPFSRAIRFLVDEICNTPCDHLEVQGLIYRQTHISWVLVDSWCQMFDQRRHLIDLIGSIEFMILRFLNTDVIKTKEKIAFATFYMVYVRCMINFSTEEGRKLLSGNNDVRDIIANFWFGDLERKHLFEHNSSCVEDMILKNCTCSCSGYGTTIN